MWCNGVWSAWLENMETTTHHTAERMDWASTDDICRISTIDRPGMKGVNVGRKHMKLDVWASRTTLHRGDFIIEQAGAEGSLPRFRAKSIIVKSVRQALNKYK